MPSEIVELIYQFHEFKLKTLVAKFSIFSLQNQVTKKSLIGQFSPFFHQTERQ